MSVFEPMLAGSGENAALGTVSRVVVEVTQLDSAPPAEVVQPAGNAGAVTPSKFCVKVAERAPRLKLYVTVPKFVALVWICSVAVMLLPHVPLAVKVNVSDTALP